MAKVIMTCGRLCSGKTTYAAELRERYNAVVLSIDELMIEILGRDLGNMHDEYARRTEQYLYKKSTEIAAAGTNVIFDTGLWTRQGRDYAKQYYSSRGIDCELHYIRISDEEWQRRIDKRNAEVKAGRSDAYFVDEGLAEKFRSLFEEPDESEVDFIVEEQ